MSEGPRAPTSRLRKAAPSLTFRSASLTSGGGAPAVQQADVLRSSLVVSTCRQAARGAVWVYGAPDVAERASKRLVLCIEHFSVPPN